MPRPTAFHTRTFPLSEGLNYREWAGYFSAASYETRHEHEYHAIRHAAALIDVSPLFKYWISGRDAARLVDRIIPRGVESIRPGRVIYTPWCDEHGWVIDDGTISRLSETEFRWTAAEPNLRWLRAQAGGLDVTIDDISETVAALAVQGPTSRGLLEAVADADIAGLRYFSVTRGAIAGRRVDISRTGYTGDLGYEIWMKAEDAVEVWDALIRLGSHFGLKPAGLLALDVARIEAALLLIDVDFMGSRKALAPGQAYSPFELGLDRLIDLTKRIFIGRAALAREAARGPARRIVGLTVDWADVSRLYERAGLPAAASPTASRVAVPVYAGSRQVGRMTSSTWSPLLKRLIGLATVDTPFAGAGSLLEVEYSVETVRCRVGATVTPTPFFNPARKTGFVAGATA